MNTSLETSTKTLSAKEPSWLAERRSAGLDQFKNLAMPTARAEEWRFASVGKLSIDNFNPVAAPSSATLDALTERSNLVSDRAGLMVYVDDAPANFECIGTRACETRRDLLTDLRSGRTAPRLDGKILPPRIDRTRLTKILWPPRRHS
jgi:hypothetical protein